MPLNDKQQIIVDNIEGIMVVDAGAGTGKTTAITKRYEKILEKVTPDKILMLTFTDNAAENMRDKIINECVGGYTPKDLVDAPISTFHSFCNKLLRQHGFDVPGVLGINEGLHNYSVMEREIYERYVFKRFFSDFQKKENNDIYSDIHKVVNSDDVFSIIKKLCCKGIFPKKNGWFNNGEELLQGNFQSYRERFDKCNQPVQGKKGPNQSAFLKSFKGKFGEHLYIDTPSEDEMFLSKQKQVNPKMMELAFYDDRTSLISFIHDAYFEYIEYCLKINRINYDFMIMFAFILLYSDHELRSGKAFDYVIVDEFQDTDEIQFMMILLLMKTNNLCVVGDWKQGIYGFRNATIDNILEFNEKIRLYRDMLNNDYQRVSFNIEPVHHEFDINYRSS